MTQEAIGFVIGAVFLVLAAWFAIGPELVTTPHNRIAVVDAADITTDPRRFVLRDPPTALMGGYDLQCRECHRLFESWPETARLLTQHQHIVLDHGLNDRCFNCHDIERRNLLVIPGEPSVPFAQVARMCANCHGTVYRDWQRGMHGRMSGYWDAESGVQTRLNCAECHDPHRPAFGQMTALPGPETLRMGDQHSAPHPGDEPHNPLRQWMTDQAEHPATPSEDAHDVPEEGGQD